MYDGFVDAYDKRTGQKRRVPAHWFDHPTLSRGLSKTPRQKAREKATPAETESVDLTPAPPEKGASDAS